ncbi:MAG: EamA family transporter, partial [Clostridia bacterium]|nr:EamA family transporter [Clostridia bacterium]
VLSVAALGVLCSIGANLLVNYAVGRMSVVKLSSFGAITTLCSMVSGVILLGEPVSWSLVIGAVLILLGIYQVTKE